MRHIRISALVLLAVIVVAACRVDTSVSVRVRDDGSGAVSARVRLDADAVQAALVGGGTLESRVRTDDLRAAGWTARWVVGGGEPPASATLVLEKPFREPSEVTGIIGELDGANGPLRRVTLRRDPGPVRTRYRFRGVADLAALDAGLAADPQLAANLSGQHVDVTGLDASLTARVKDALRFTVAVDLPGAAPRRWVLKPGGRAVLATSSSTVDRTRVALLGVGVAFGIAAVVLLVVGERRARRRRRRRSASPGASPGPPDPPEPAGDPWPASW